MCLEVRPGCKIEVTDHDIPVFRYFNRYGFFKKRWGSMIMKTEERRKYNVPIKACDHLLAIRFYFSLTIYEGFHSHELCEYFNKPNAIIPKGSEYCLGTGGEIVSNQIIVFSSRWHLRRYLRDGK